MIRPTRLSATFACKVKDPGRFGDGRGGHGLALDVKQSASGRFSKSWVQRLRIYGRPTNIGLGPYPAVSLAEARQKSLENVQKAMTGEDPRVKPKTVPTLEESIEETLVIMRPKWKVGSKTEKTLRGIMRRQLPKSYCRMPVDKIDCADMIDLLKPLAIEKPETARKLRVFLGQVFKAAVPAGFRTDDPTDARIESGLPNRAEGKNHRSMEWVLVKYALETIRETDAWWATKLALEFTVATAARSGEVRNATWDEIRAGGLYWQIPAERMKSKREHSIPLNQNAMRVLSQASTLAGGRTGLIFPSQRGLPLSDSTLSKLLRESGVEAVPHGFRSSFRNWATETGEDDTLAEISLAHVVGPKAKQAYLTTEALQRRSEMMHRWGNELGEPLPEGDLP